MTLHEIKNRLFTLFDSLSLSYPSHCVVVISYILKGVHSVSNEKADGLGLPIFLKVTTESVKSLSDRKIKIRKSASN